MHYLKLIRYKNLLMILFTMILTKYALIDSFGDSQLSTRGFIFLSILVLLIAAAGYVINDIYDIKADIINKPKKLYVSKFISKKRAWIFYAVLTSTSLILSIFFSQNSLEYVVFIGSPIMLWLYSNYFKRIALLGNLVISLLAIFPIIMVYYVEFISTYSDFDIFYKNLYFLISFYIVFAFLSTFIREIIKDIEDIKGYYSLKMNTLPIVIGSKRARNIAIILMIISMLILVITLKLFYANNWYLPTAGALILLYFKIRILRITWFAVEKKEFQRISAELKLFMFLGISSMFLFKFI